MRPLFLRARMLPTSLIATLFVAVVGCNNGNFSDKYVHVPDEDAAMNTAISKAKETVSEFVAAFHAQKPDTKEFYVKKPYKTPAGGYEHMWINVTAEENGVIRGIVSNDAEETREVKLGDSVSFNLTDISDWKYQQGNKLVGGYTIRYFVERMPPAEREAFFKEVGFEF